MLIRLRIFEFMVLGRVIRLRVKAALSIELDNKVLVNWILNPSQRPWGVARSMIEIDNLVCECVAVYFKSVALQELAMEVILAQNRIDKRDWLIAWCPIRPPSPSPIDNCLARITKLP
ncbi:hypothetical protein V6N12_027865 [Hibiscus sabdariffa]|uniref:Uncharacterized protein n=1 Tax=Hibiscus sabdariffa TaxID=183260 RepID=A0ABR2F444_9ROSI